MNTLFSSYSRISRGIIFLLIAEFFLQLINMALLQILLIYMEKSGYPDFKSAGFVAYRFLGVLLFSIPLGLMIKGRKIMPFFYIASIATPLLTFLIIFATEQRYHLILNASQFLWGISFICMQVTVLPFILRNSPSEHHTETISLSYATGSLGAICSGIIIFNLDNFLPEIFNEKTILQLIAGMGFISIFFIYKMQIREKVPIIKKKNSHEKNSIGWTLIIKALIPTTIIAIGAGLTIPFIGLFFFKIHHLDSDQFALLNAMTTILVFFLVILVPKLKYRYGYKLSVTLSQAIAVFALIVLATTEWYALKAFAVFIAIFCYALRQPLMNMAAPLTSDMTMKYVGKRNREMMSALSAAIWSGSWFVSSHIFRILREQQYAYSSVFMITAVLYGTGVLWYYFLILDYERREALGLIEK